VLVGGEGDGLPTLEAQPALSIERSNMTTTVSSAVFLIRGDDSICARGISFVRYKLGSRMLNGEHVVALYHRYELT
jgi:hypothetical protein